MYQDTHLSRTADVRKTVLRYLNHPLLIVAMCLCCLDPAQASNRPAQNLSERAKNAENQLKAYRQRVVERNYLQKPTMQSLTRMGAQQQPSRSPNSSAVFYFQDDCESGTLGWTVDLHSDTAEWHLTTKDANTPTHSWWAGSESLGTYDVGTRVREGLISSPIDLSLVSAPVTLLFSENYVTEHGWDFCMVDVSTDAGSTWSHLRGGYGDSPSGDSFGWIVTTLDLSPYAGHVINIRFLFDTGDSLFNSFPGWFIDNVHVFDQYGTVQGMVYYDQNQNGTYDLAELGLNDWLITISGPISLTATTKYAGFYQVPLPLGSYTISSVQQSPWTQTSSPATWNVTLSTQGEFMAAVSFGEYRQGCVFSGLVFRDQNKDSVYEAGEPPLTGAWLNLIDPSDMVVQSALSDTGGHFGFVVINPGLYSLVQYSHFNDTQWVSTIPGGNPPTYYVTALSRDTVIGGLLFGNYPVSAGTGTASISGWVFNDVNQDSLQDIREPMVAGMEIDLSGPAGTGNVLTDTAGRFSFMNLPAGTYTVTMHQQYRWRQTVPSASYIIPLSDGQAKDSVIFGAYQLPVGTVAGTLFNDLNRNGVQDTLEPPLTGWSVAVTGPYPWEVDAFTDSLGHFRIDTIVAGPHTVNINLPAHWQLSPPGSYPITLAPLQVLDSLKIGAYALVPSSISGVIFNDANANMVRDSGEGGVPGIQVYLVGRGAVTSDDTGHYKFDTLWSSSFQVRLVMTNRWRQTYPALLQPQLVYLGSEDQRTDVNFGMRYDSTFSLSFRTFLPESIAHARDSKGKLRSEKPKPYNSEATFDLVVPTGGLNGLHLEFNQTIFPSKFVASRFPVITYDSYMKRWELGLSPGDTLATGEHVTFYARGNKGKTLYVSRYWWKSPTSVPAIGTTVGRYFYGQGRLLLQMPNPVNVIESSYLLGFGGSSRPGLTVGVYGPHSVYHQTAKDVTKSLIDQHGMHIGPPRCLGVFANTLRPIIRAMRAMTPTKGNNILFAEALTLKVNILASDLGILPYGLGDLIFQGEAGNRWNGNSVRTIAAELDTAMSAFDPVAVSCVHSTSFFDTAYAVIRSIDSAFSGPFDTLSFYNGLTLSPVRNIADVPFLHIDSSFSALASSARRHVVPPALPQTYVLHQNYPNPFNPTTTIEFYLVTPGIVSLTIYNTLGQEVARPIDRQYMDEGWGDFEFSSDAYKLSSGVYFYRLTADPDATDENSPPAKSVTLVRKMVLLK